MTTPPSVPPQGSLPPARVTTSPAGDRRTLAHKRRQRVLAAALALLLVAGVGWALLQSGNRGPTGAARYTTVAAERGSVSQQVVASGTVAKVNEMSVRFPTSATVTELRATVGDTVTAGDVLAVIDDTSLRTKVLTAQAAVDAAALSLQQVKQVETPARTAEAPAARRQPAGPVAGGGGMPLPLPPPLPEAPEPHVDLSPLDAARAEAEAAASAVAQRTAEAHLAVDAMKLACRPSEPVEAPPTTPEATPEPTPAASPEASPDPSPEATPEPTTEATPEPTTEPSAEPTLEPTAEPSELAGTIPQPSASPGPATMDAAACQAAAEKVIEAQAKVTEAQAAATVANARGPEAVGGAGMALAMAVEQVRGWVEAITRALGSWQEQVARAQSAPTGGPQGGQAGFPELLGNGSAGSQEAASVNRSAIVQAEVALAKARRDLSAAQEALASATMRAPMAGTVSALPWTEGSTATASERAVVTAPGAVTVTVAIPASSFLAVKPGQQATVRAPGGVEATAVVAGKALVPNASGSFPVTILTTSSNADQLAGGSSARVEIGVSSASDVVVVPLSAVTRSGDEGMVRKLLGDEAVDMPVKLGSVGDTRVEVVEGVEPGDRLVVADATRPLLGLNFGGPG